MEYIVMYKDADGMPRAQAWGEVENMEDVKAIREHASLMLDKYIESKPYPISRDEFTRYSAKVPASD